MSRKYLDAQLQNQFNRFRWYKFRVDHGSKKAGLYISYLFNNFSLNLPGSNKRKFFEEKEKLNEPLGRARESLFFKHSELYLNQTRGEFYSAIDESLNEEGIYYQVVEIFSEANSSILKISSTKLNILVAPAWFRLREKGYSHRDLY